MQGRPKMFNSTGDAPRADDALIAQLLTEALTMLDADRQTARRRIDQARSLAMEPSTCAGAVAGGLAVWQMRRLVGFVQANLSTKLRINQAARVIGVSPTHLSRAFKASAGVTYSEFVLRARIALAKRLLLTTDAPICDVALTCGLSDQSHLTRIFKQAAGLPPAAWRRQFARGVASRWDEARNDDPLFPSRDLASAT